MSFKMPSTEQVRQLGDSLGLEVTEDYANSFINFIRPFGDGYRLLASLPDDVPMVKYPRGACYRPVGDENKYGAWIAKTSVKGAGSGKLAGKKVAVKDTYALAGVPLTNGASVLEGFVPEFDAPVITRLLDAGAEIVGKSVCEYFSFSGGAATSISGPVHNLIRRADPRPGRAHSSPPAKWIWRPAAIKPARSAFPHPFPASSASSRLGVLFLIPASWGWTRRSIMPGR